MRGKSTEFARDFDDQAQSPVLRQDAPKSGNSESSARVKSYSDGLGIFKRSLQYGELVDDATSGPPPSEQATAQDSSWDSEHEQAQGEHARQQRSTSSDGILARLHLKDRHSPGESGAKGEGKQRTLAPAKAGSFVRGNSRGSSGVKTLPLPTKKTKMQSAGVEYEGISFEALQDEEGRSPPSRGSHVQNAQPKDSLRDPLTPGRSSEPTASVSRSSPSLMSQAARLASSIGQGPRKAMARRKTDDFEPMENERPDGTWDDRGQEDKWQERDATNGARSPANGGAVSGGGVDATQTRSDLHRPSRDARGAHDTARPIPNPASTPQQSGETRLDTEASSRDPSGDPERSEAFDIFEPRPSEASEMPAGSVTGRNAAAVSQSLSDVKCMKGHEALQALEKGSLMRKKWVGTTSAEAANQSQKTERLIRCRVENNRVVLHYHHQGVKGLLAKEEVSTTVQRVEVPDGAWREGECILVHTARGVLALAAPNAATHATWVLGLNAALVSCDSRGKDVLLSAPVHAIPRNAMFVVTPPL